LTFVQGIWCPGFATSNAWSSWHIDSKASDSRVWICNLEWVI